MQKEPTKRWTLMANDDRNRLTLLDKDLVLSCIYNTRAELYYRVFDNQFMDADAQREQLREKLTKILGQQGLAIDYQTHELGDKPTLKVEVKETALLVLKTLERERDKYNGLSR